MTNTTLCVTLIFSSGFPGTATISASFPTSSVPMVFCKPSRSAPDEVPARNACAGVIPSLGQQDKLNRVVAVRVNRRVSSKRQSSRQAQARAERLRPAGFTAMSAFCRTSGGNFDSANPVRTANVGTR